VRDGDEVAETMEDRLAPIDLDPAEDVRVVADHDVGAAVDRRPAELPLVLVHSDGDVTDSLVERHDDHVDSPP
jgi:hypothetical protein